MRVEGGVGCHPSKMAECDVKSDILTCSACKNQKELKQSDRAKRSRLTCGLHVLGWHVWEAVFWTERARFAWVAGCIQRLTCGSGVGVVAADGRVQSCERPPLVPLDFFAGVTKLFDANDAGTRNSHMCSLTFILCRKQDAE
jgi:hypothetical protein